VESRIKSHALKYDVIIQSSTSRPLKNGFVLASIIVQFVATYFSTCDVDKPNELVECLPTKISGRSVYSVSSCLRL
jgi:hypothetical protein